MNIKFKDINPGMYPARISNIKEESGPYGSYLRFSFTITEGELKDWSFYGIVKPHLFKQSKFYRWIISLVGNATPAEIKRAFALAPRELNRWLRQYREEGPGFFYTNQSGVEIMPKGLLARMVRKIQSRLNEAKKRLQSIGHFGLRMKKE